jgi:hypothetical protein
MSVAVAISSECVSRVGMVDLTSSDSQMSAVPSRCCTTCATPILAARLKAKPNATECVACLQTAGDVTLTHDYAVRRTIRNSALLSDLTEAPILPVRYDTTGQQTDAEIISGLNELSINEGLDKSDHLT